MILTLEVDYWIEQVVYLKTDPDQLPRMVFSYIVFQNTMCYRLTCGTATSTHYGFEISPEKSYT